MLKKCIGFVTVAGIASAMVFGGCSSTTTTTDNDSGVTDSGRRPDTAPAADTGPGPGDDAGSCIGAAPASYSWNPPTTAAAACDATQLANLGTAITTAKTIDDLKAAITDATCSACIFGTLADNPWKATQTDRGGFIGNYGGCAIVAAGATAACGQALQAFGDCGETACGDCASGSQDETDCFKAVNAAGGVCETQAKAMAAACPQAVGTAVDAKCTKLVDIVKWFCGTGPGDAASDG